jgi:hypothetical protein
MRQTHQLQWYQPGVRRTDVHCVAYISLFKLFAATAGFTRSFALRAAQTWDECRRNIGQLTDHQYEIEVNYNWAFDRYSQMTARLCTYVASIGVRSISFRK